MAEDDEPPAYKRGEIIWAKLKGFPWWPAQIRSLRELIKPPSSGEPPRLRVRFLHTLDNAELPLNLCRPYAPHAAEFGVVTKKMFKTAGPRKKFEAAVAEAAAWTPPPAHEEEEWSDDNAEDEDDVAPARQEASEHLDLWRTSGHELVGRHIARHFGHTNKKPNAPKPKAFLAVITRWLPAEDKLLFHAVHDDGDEEDLEEEEARKAATIYSRQPEERRRKHEKHVERLAKLAAAEARARQPRKARSAFYFFSQAVRPALAAAHPDATMPAMARLIAQAWRVVTAEERDVHDAAAAADVKRYVAECEAAGIEPGKAARASAGPADALAAVGFFRGRAEAAFGVTLGVSLGDEADLPHEVAAILKMGFAELGHEERDELDDLAAADAERYEEDVAAWQERAKKRRLAREGHAQAAAAPANDGGGAVHAAPAAVMGGGASAAATAAARGKRARAD